jgi:hypothetical protein
MYLQDIRFIDLRNSDWDEKQSDPAKGAYQFGKKVYLKYRDNSNFHYAWCRYDGRSIPPYADLWDWKTQWGYTPVEAGKDEVWPEGMPPNENGQYVLGDLILVKTPMKNYLEKRARELGASENASKAIIKQFYNESRAMGMDVDEATVGQILSSR